jgi:hypothetical protein
MLLFRNGASRGPLQAVRMGVSMSDVHDVQLLIESHVPILVIESHEEKRILRLFGELALGVGRPAYSWSVTEGLKRIDLLDFPVSGPTEDAAAALAQIKSTREPGIYLLLDFHPYLDDPINVRLLRRFLSTKLPAYLSFRPPAVLRKGLHSWAMRPFARLAGRRKSCAIW